MMPKNNKIEPCPMPECGGECMPSDAERAAKILHMKAGVKVYCKNIECQYQAPSIPAHNQLCKLKRLGELVEKVIKNPPKQPHPMGGRYDGGWADAIQAYTDLLTLPVEDTELRGVQSDSEAPDRRE